MTGQFKVDYMRGYGQEWWVREVGAEGVQTYALQVQAQRYADLRNAGARREAAMAAVSSGCDVIMVGSLVFVDSFAGLIPAKVVTLVREPWELARPGTSTAHWTQIRVRVRVTAGRGAFKRGEVLEYTGRGSVRCVVSRKDTRVKGGQYRIKSGAFNV